MKKHFLVLGGVVLTVLVMGLITHAMAADQQFVNLGNGICQDSETGLMWQLDKSRRPIASEAKARQYIRDLKLGEFTDWRLPTMAERWKLTQNVELYRNTGPCDFVHFEKAYWTTATENGTEPLKLGLTCICQGDEEIDLVKKGYVRVVRDPRQSLSQHQQP